MGHREAGRHRTALPMSAIIMALAAVGTLSDADDAGPRARAIKHWWRVVGKINLVFHQRESYWTLAGDFLQAEQYNFSLLKEKKRKKNQSKTEVPDDVPPEDLSPILKKSAAMHWAQMVGKIILVLHARSVFHVAGMFLKSEGYMFPKIKLKKNKKNKKW